MIECRNGIVNINEEFGMYTQNERESIGSRVIMHLFVLVFCLQTVRASLFPEADVSDPNPADGQTNVSINTHLSWSSGALFFSLVISTDYDEVATTVSEDLLDNPSYDPGTLKPCTTYYWRVIELMAFGYGVGPIWQFTTGNCAPADPATLLAHWKADSGPADILQDDSGNALDAEVYGDPIWVYGMDQLAVAVDGNDYFVAPAPTNGSVEAMSVSAWVYPTSAAYTYTGILLTQGNESAGLRLRPNNELGYSWKGAAISANFSTAIFLTPEEWSFLALVVEPTKASFYVDGALGVQRAEHAILHPACALNTSVLIGMDSLVDGTGFVGLLDDVRLYEGALTDRQIETAQQGASSAASMPVPRPYVDVKDPVTLSWKGAVDAVMHDVYLGNDLASVLDATPQTEAIYMGRQAATSFAVTTVAGQAYFWRIDEVNAQGRITTGTVWSFTASADLVIDDMESYTDIEPGRIYDFWLDGYNQEDNGSLVGHYDPPYCELDENLFGLQSMPFYYNYDHVNTPITSEITLDLNLNIQDAASNRDVHLAFWCRGDLNNTITEDDTLYVKLNDRIVYLASSGFLQYPIWTAFSVPLTAFNGLDTTHITAITFGIGDPQGPKRSGQGTLFIDQIKLALVE